MLGSIEGHLEGSKAFVYFTPNEETTSVTAVGNFKSAMLSDDQLRQEGPLTSDKVDKLLLCGIAGSDFSIGYNGSLSDIFWGPSVVRFELLPQ